jgi:hypothetical protein
MKKILLIATAPLLLIDACSAVRLTRKEASTEKVVTSSTTYSKPESVSRGNTDSKKQIVVRELSNGEFNLSTRFEPTIKDHYRKEIIQLKANPEE